MPPIDDELSEEYFLPLDDLSKLFSQPSRQPSFNDLHNVFEALTAEHSIVLGELTRDETGRFNSLADDNRDSPEYITGIVRKLPNAVGVTQEPGRPLHFMLLNSFFHQQNNAFSFTTKITSTGATSLRFEIQTATLDKSTKVYVTDGIKQVFGPYNRNEQAFWSNTIKGSTAYVQIQIQAPDIRFTNNVTVSRIVHGIREAEEAGEDLDEDPAAVDCNLKPFCYPASGLPNQSIFNKASDGVGKLLYVKGDASYVASGGLLRNSRNLDYLLTANHCIASQAVASTLEVVWRFRRPCGMPLPIESLLPTSLGSTLIATSSRTDFTLLHLDNPPPRGSYFFPWSTVDYSQSNQTIYRIHHPLGMEQHYQVSKIRNLGGCSRKIGNFIYSNPHKGITAGGSSGSPCFIQFEDDAVVIGQLFGSCPVNPQTCSHANIDGAFAITYTLISSYL